VEERTEHGDDSRRRARNLLVTDDARNAYQTWREHPRRRRVVPVVESHRTRVLYDLTPQDVEQVCRDTEHALGEVKSKQVARISGARDWNPDFAFTHLLHYCMEQQKRLPTWQEFRHFLLETEEGHEMLGRQARQCRDSLIGPDVSKDLATDAMRWRVGNSYYGVLRDIYTVVQLRAQGLDVRAHPLADALFRVDAWSGRTVLSLRVRNAMFRDAHGGRKLPAEDLLRDARPRFHVEPIELEPADKFGVVHLPKQTDIRHAAQRLTQRSTSSTLQRPSPERPAS
jgi:hypothetical protein